MKLQNLCSIHQSWFDQEAMLSCWEEIARSVYFFLLPFKFLFSPLVFIFQCFFPELFTHASSRQLPCSALLLCSISCFVFMCPSRLDPWYVLTLESHITLHNPCICCIHMGYRLLSWPGACWMLLSLALRLPSDGFTPLLLPLLFLELSRWLPAGRCDVFVSMSIFSALLFWVFITTSFSLTFLLHTDNVSLCLCDRFRVMNGLYAGERLVHGILFLSHLWTAKEASFSAKIDTTSVTLVHSFVLHTLRVVILWEKI